jgi:hypothetical protein
MKNQEKKLVSGDITCSYPQEFDTYDPYIKMFDPDPNLKLTLIPTALKP